MYFFCSFKKEEKGKKAFGTSAIFATLKNQKHGDDHKLSESKFPLGHNIF